LIHFYKRRLRKAASIHTATTAVNDVNEDLHATKKRDKLIKLTA